MRMLSHTGADGVVVGRGCLGRPWLFRDLAAAFAGEPSPPLPRLGEVAVMMRRHAELLAELRGEDRGLRDMRNTWPSTSRDSWSVRRSTASDSSRPSD